MSRKEFNLIFRQEVSLLGNPEDAFPKNQKLINSMEVQKEFQEARAEQENKGSQENGTKAQSMQVEGAATEPVSSTELVKKFHKEIVGKDVDLLHKKIKKLRKEIDQRKVLNKKLVEGLRKKKNQIGGLVDEVNDVYTKVNKLSMEYEVGTLETNKLKEEIDTNEKRLYIMRAILTDSYKETRGLREEILRKEEVIGELTDRLREMESESNELKEKNEDIKEEKNKLLNCIEFKEVEKRAARDEFEHEVKKQEFTKEKIQKEKDDIFWGLQTLKILVGQTKGESERLRVQIEEKNHEALELSRKLEEVRKERDEIKGMCQKISEERRNSCAMF